MIDFIKEKIDIIQYEQEEILKDYNSFYRLTDKTLFIRFNYDANIKFERKNLSEFQVHVELTIKRDAIKGVSFSYDNSGHWNMSVLTDIPDHGLISMSFKEADNAKRNNKIIKSYMDGMSIAEIKSKYCVNNQ